MSIFYYVLKSGGVSTTLPIEHFEQLHPRQLDFSSYGVMQIDLIAFKVDFKYVSAKGKSSIKTTSRTFLVAYDKLPPREYGERSDRCKKYFLDWAMVNKSTFNKVTILSLKELGDVSFSLEHGSNATSLREFILDQNKKHVHFQIFTSAHEKNCIIDLELKFNMYEIAYRYETVRNNIKESRRVIFTTGLFDEMHLPYMLSTSISRENLDKNRQLSNVEILEGNLAGRFSLVA